MSGSLYQQQLAEIECQSRRTRDRENAEARNAAEYLFLRNFMLAEEHAREYKSQSRRLEHMLWVLDELVLNPEPCSHSSPPG